MNKQQIAPYVIFGISFISIVAVFSFDAIPQNTQYHNYIDGRNLFGINNFGNVLSNLPFLMVGLWGLYGLLKAKNLTIINEFKAVYVFLFVSISLVFFGSSYYHLTPNNHTLVWDRIPITCAFMALFAIAVAELASLKMAKIIFLPSLILGILAVFYWDYSESIGQGDLRYYALVQLLPLIIMPMLLVFYPAKLSKSSAYWWLFITYGMAKVFELLDADIYHQMGFISGHSLKHLAAALGLAVLVHSFQHRKWL